MNGTLFTGRPTFEFGFEARMLAIWEDGPDKPITMRDYQRYKASLFDVHARIVRLGGGGLIVPTNQPVAKRRGHVVLLQYWQGIEARSGRWEHMPQRLLLIERTHRD